MYDLSVHGARSWTVGGCSEMQVGSARAPPALALPPTPPPKPSPAIVSATNYMC
jgi:hypothetical protein